MTGSDTFTVGKVSRKEADLATANVERILLRVKQKLLLLPAGVGIVEFVKNDGRAPTTNGPLPSTLDFHTLKERYLSAHSKGSMEESSLGTIKIHLKHLQVTLGERFQIGQLAPADLQRHIDRRCAGTFHGRLIGAVTVRKEVTTLRAVWN